MKASVLVLLLLLQASAQIVVDASRLGDKPVLEPGPAWASTGTFNPTAVEFHGKTVLLFRATDAKMISRIGYAESPDGLHFKIREQPVLAPEAPYEIGGGVEDPRLVFIAGTYYLTYTGYNGHDAQLCLATSRDLIHWDRKGVILPAYKGTWNPSGPSLARFCRKESGAAGGCITSARVPTRMVRNGTTWASPPPPIFCIGPMRALSLCSRAAPARSIRA